MENSIAEFLKGYGPFAVLFFFLLVFVLKEYKDNKQQSREREEKLMSHIAKSDEHITKSDETLKEISANVKEISMTQSLMQKDIDILKDKID